MGGAGGMQNIQVPLSAPFVQYKRLVTALTPKGPFTFSVIHRSRLEQGPWSYPVLLHCWVVLRLRPFVYRFVILQRRARLWTVVVWWHWFLETQPSKSVNVEWGSARRELLILFFLFRWLLGFLFLVLWHVGTESGGGGETRVVKFQLHPQGKMPFKWHQHDSGARLWFTSLRGLYNQACQCGKTKQTRKVSENPSNRLQPEDNPGGGGGCL